MTDVNYFICTLGQAALPGVNRPFQDVNDLISQQALKKPNLPAVGFYVPSAESETYVTKVLTFADLLQGVSVTAELLVEHLDIAKGQTVGLLSSSSPAFLFSWLALIQLGHPVLLVAPQCSPAAIGHLSKACQAPVLFFDEPHRKLAGEAASRSKETEFPDLTAQKLPFTNDTDVFDTISKKPTKTTRESEVSRSDIAYLHHTSGTSTGIPKPIPQTHHGGVGVLPALDGSATATFTTTPLYHGGVADSFRAWASGALIWLFPSQHVPITAPNIVKCLEASQAATTSNQVPSIKYFSSVPYVLQMIAQDENGLKHLQSMDIVGVGGAALPPEVGNKLVDNDVNLVSRYGSAECGFLMSSHRDYPNDKGWHYLRRSEDVENLKFERNEDGQSELIVLPGWPHMAKTNREDGSFATSDLFAPHPELPHTWRYHSRADSQLTLITGKKFDPSPLEGSLAASSPLLNEVLVFGNGRPYPGVLLFRSEAARDLPDTEICKQLTQIVESLNVGSQSHARIPRNMLTPMAYEAVPLDKSSKGTILRGKAEEKYETQIEASYNKTAVDGDLIDDDEVPDTISNIIDSVVGTTDEQLTHETDLFAYGVDSVACVQIRHAVAQLLPKDAAPLPLTVVEDSGTISRLADLVIQLRRGEIDQSQENQGELILKMVDQYSDFHKAGTGPPSKLTQQTGRTILMTGPTGSLGAHMLSQMLDDARVTKIHLLVRGATPHAAHERVVKALTTRQLPVPSTFDDKVTVHPCKLSDPRLGLSDTTYKHLSEHVETIIHLAWSVNFLISLRTLASTHLAGLQNLLNLAITSPRDLPAHFLFCSSVASVSQFLSSSPIPEKPITNPLASGPTGYAQSKLAAELICHRCATTSSTNMHNRISILRVGQLSGDTNHGVWNTSEAYPLMLASSLATGTLPDLTSETLGWLPVDVAATAFREAAAVDPDNSDPVRVLHLLNPSRATVFADMVRVVDDDVAVETVAPDEWLARLEGLRARPETSDHPALRLLAFWKGVYGSSSGSVGRGEEGGRSGDGGKRVTESHEMEVSLRTMPELEKAVGPLNTEYMRKLWRWIKLNV